MATVTGRYLSSFSADSHYLKTVRVEPSPGSGAGHITEDELQDGLDWAEEQVDAHLGAIEPAIGTGDDCPHAIRDIIRRLASAKILGMTLTGNVPHASKHVAGMRNSALNELKAIQNGKQALVLIDLTLHPVLKGPGPDGDRFTDNDNDEQKRSFHTQTNRDDHQWEYADDADAPESDDRPGGYYDTLI